MSDNVIGIDLGTTNSCVCVYQDDKVKLLENDEGRRVTSSFVYFHDKGTIVGQSAKKGADKKPENGIYEVKRLIGRKYNDQYVQKNLTYLPFKVQKSVSNESEIIFTQNNKVIKQTPQEICSFILKKLKTDAEAKLGHPVDKAVITVPAYFNVRQREATLAASQEAGFKVLKLLSEPTAAALSYYYDQKKNLPVEESFSLVYDLGGGTFDVAILSCKGTDIKIIGVDGDTHLGGHDFDNLLIEYVSQFLINKYNYNPKNDTHALRRLKNLCQEAKEEISNIEETIIELRGFGPESDITDDIPITRVTLENLCHDLFQRTIDIVDSCLQKCKLTKRDIKEIILSGGSTRIPKIQNMIRVSFGRKDLNKLGNLDECVAEGAAIQAAMLSTDKSQAIQHIKITDVTPLSLGISVLGGLMDVVIERNTPIPTSSMSKFGTTYNNQTDMRFSVYEGERSEAKKNHFLDSLDITGLTPAPPGECEVSLTMKIDQNGILQVTATETVSYKTKTLTIAYARGRRSEEEVREAVVDARENKIEDERFRQFAKLKVYLIKYCVGIKFNLEEKNFRSTYKNVYDACTEALSTTKNSEIKDEGELAKLKAKIVALCDPIVKLYNFERMPIMK